MIAGQADDTPADVGSPTAKSEPQKPSVRSRWLLLPVIGVVSLVVFVSLMELAARLLFTETSLAANVCLVLDDPSHVVKARPNCACRLKTLESGWVEYHFNDRGHRSNSNYQLKAPGAYRIVMIGSSMAEGYTVPLDESFAGRLPALLEKETGKPVEVYDEGLESSAALNTDKRFGEALAADPDLILWPVTPWDVLHATDDLPKDPAGTGASAVGRPAKRQGLLARVKTELTRKRDIVGGLRDHFRSFFMLQHFLYRSPSIYLAHTINGTDEYTPSIEARPDAEWERRLHLLDLATADMATRARKAGVPFVVMALPRHAQAVMIASGSWPAQLDPFAFGNQVKAIVEKNGGTYIDILSDFRHIPDVHSGFYPVDQHLEPAGQIMFAQIMAKELVNGSVPSLRAVTDPELNPHDGARKGGAE